jgi:hypothetical protein
MVVENTLNHSKPMLVWTALKERNFHDLSIFFRKTCAWFWKKVSNVELKGGGMHSRNMFYTCQGTTRTPCTTQITCMKDNYIRKTICGLWFSTIHINPHFCKGLYLTLGKVVLISLTLLEKRCINYNLILMINTS